jgi:ribonuclease P protein component
MPNFGFSKELRLLRASQFERVFAARASANNAWLTVYGANNDVGHPRLGITATRRLGNAVARNRWKRVLREAYRLSQDLLPALDLVCVARAPSPPPLNQLAESLVLLAGRISSRLTQTKDPRRTDRS